MGAIRALETDQFTSSTTSERLKKKVRRRFVHQTERLRRKTQDSFVNNVIGVFHEYYRNCLLNLAEIKSNERKLFVSLARLLEVKNFKSTKKSNDMIVKSIETELKKKGFHSRLLFVSPLKCLLVWRQQDRKLYNVELPEQKQAVKVTFMKDFIELGWLNYCTFGKYYVGGWAEKQMLFCVTQGYNLKSYRFKVHYLAHEAQHFSDYKKFPTLHSVDLEYRAKLTELALTPYPKRFVKHLMSESNKDKRFPHSYAAHCIVKQMTTTSNSRQLKVFAKSLLREHTQMLELSGRAKVRSSL